ncbi:MAG: alpha/beta fold hydrolase [Clostridiales bacterium]|nr:alpha/beta fold hydrolase [Clostridiales bacterium]
MRNGRKFPKIITAVVWMVALLLLLGAAAAETPAGAREPLDYSDAQNWVYFGSENGEAAADVFFIAPSAFGGKEGSYLMDLGNEKGRNNFIGAINMEKGIYDRNTRFYAPLYRQAGYNVYTLPEEEAETLILSAYADIRDAFAYYMDSQNGGRPLVLAGFSEGAEMAVRLMKEYFGDESLRKQLVACYAIGWRLTAEETEEWPQLRPAQGETDTGVIITFTAEAEDVTESAFIPAGMKSLSINPLNWKTDGEKAGRELNLGACFTDYSGTILEEVPALTGACLDAERGTLKVTDIDPEVYNATLPILGPGVYHLYDYQFFYRNLQQNVQDRIRAYTAGQTDAAAGETRRMETAADADEWIAVFLGEHPEELEGRWSMSVQMEAAAAQLGGIAGLAKQMAALGTVAEIHPAYEEEIQGYKTFFIPCVFSAMQKDLILIVRDGAIAGLQVGNYSGDRDADRAESDAFDSIELALPVPSLGELPGILTVPKGDGPFPVVILLQGSGASDRDEAVGNVKPFRDLAEGLAPQGVAVYRFDKRNYVYGTELAEKKDATLVDEYIEDAVNAVQLVAGQDRIDPDRIFVLGHSLGGNAIPAIARELEQAPVKACGFIMLAASPRRLDVLIREQYDFVYSLMPEVTAEQQAEKDMVFAELDKLQDLDALTEDDQVIGTYAAYWKWLAEYDILEAAKEITKPVLLLQGEEDYQVTMVDFEMWKEAVGGRDNWRMISYPGLTHLFMPGAKSEGPDAYARGGKIQENVIRDIATFINGAE